MIVIFNGEKMTTPQPPKKQKVNFPDPDFHQQKKAFHKQIREIIFKFYDTIPRSQNRDSLLKFADCLLLNDVTKLPYVGRGTNAASENKIACVFALVSYMVQLYWKYCVAGGGLASNIQKKLDQLNQIHSDGLDQYQIKGGLASGFYLEKK